MKNGKSRRKLARTGAWIGTLAAIVGLSAGAMAFVGEDLPPGGVPGAPGSADQRIAPAPEKPRTQPPTAPNTNGATPGGDEALPGTGDDGDVQRRIERQSQIAADDLETLADIYATNGRPQEAAAAREQARQLRGQGSVVQPVAHATFYGIAANVGDRMYALLTGPAADAAGRVWGSDVYSDDSDPAAAAVHAGLLKPGETRLIAVVWTNPPEHFTGSERNGVKSSDYGKWDRAYKLETDDNKFGERIQLNGPNPSPNSVVRQLRGGNGNMLLLNLTGSTRGTVWGDGTYTDDSDLDTAAVHAGALADGATGYVKVILRPGANSYPASEKHGIASRAFGQYPGSYEVVLPRTFPQLAPEDRLQELKGAPGLGGAER